MSKLTGVARAADAFRNKNKMGPQTEDSVLLALFAHGLIDKNNKVVVNPRDLAATLQNLLAAAPATGDVALMRTSKQSYTLAHLQAGGAVDTQGFGFQSPDRNGWFVFGWILSIDDVIAQSGLSAAVAALSTDTNGAWSGDIDVHNVSGNVASNDVTGDVDAYPIVFPASDVLNVQITLTGKNFDELTSGGISLTLFYVPIP